MSEPTVLIFSRRLTGYDQEDTRFTISMKSGGTAPDIRVSQTGQYKGELTLDERAAKELARTLLYLINEKLS